MRIAIAGGTGTVGRHVLACARATGADPVVLSRGRGVDLMQRTGLAEILRGVDAVIDVSSTKALSTKGARAFFETVTSNLLEAETVAGVRHHVVLSIIGAAKADSGHYAGKALQEQLVMSSGQAWSILRTTQFHEFAAQTAQRGALLGLVISPRLRCQPISAAVVARELVSISTAAPRGLVPDLAGPRQEDMHVMVRRYLRAIGARQPVLRVTLPGKIGRVMRDGALLPSPGTRRAGQTFDQWLEETVDSCPPSVR